MKSDMSPAVQAKLAGRRKAPLERVGEPKRIEVDIRLIAANEPIWVPYPKGVPFGPVLPHRRDGTVPASCGNAGGSPVGRPPL